MALVLRPTGIGDVSTSWHMRVFELVNSYTVPYPSLARYGLVVSTLRAHEVRVHETMVHGTPAGHM